jgi:hypothetical protein
MNVIYDIKIHKRVPEYFFLSLPFYSIFYSVQHCGVVKLVFFFHRNRVRVEYFLHPLVSVVCLEYVEHVRMENQKIKKKFFCGVLQGLRLRKEIRERRNMLARNFL